MPTVRFGQTGRLGATKQGREGKNRQVVKQSNWLANPKNPIA